MAEPRVATYRWQLEPASPFAAAEAAVPDLARLGISHLYLSPIAEAVPGSTHGYDVTDPSVVRAELGGEDELRALAAACLAAHGVGLVVDIVPNHLAAHPANPYWWDVLRLGRASRWASLFDVDWNPPKRELRETILVPILGDHYGRELEAGTIHIEAGAPGHVLVVAYHEHRLPLSPGAVGELLDATARRAGDDELGAAARLLHGVEAGGLELDARDADLALAERTALARLADRDVAAALEIELRELHADHDRLDAILDAQHHRLARWRVADAELGYRRFFDVDTLVATRADEPVARELLFALPIRLVREGVVAGLRLDHIDGLRDPGDTLTRLREQVGPDCWLLVEKIVRPGEALPASWPVDGTTGYEVAERVGGWLTHPAGAAAIEARWRELTGIDGSFAELAHAARHEVLAAGLAADVERLTDAFVRVCEGRRRHRDHARADLRAALVAVAASVGAYRSYVAPTAEAPDHVVASPTDLALIHAAVAAARVDRPDLDPELLDLVGDVLGGRYAGAAETAMALRFQQLTGPVAAKGEEDTALYRYLPLPHRCEVGTDPGHPVVTADEWHAAGLGAAHHHPAGMTTLTTHDTKRAADVRARLAAATTLPDVLLAGFDAWDAAWGQDAVDVADRWLVFHTVLGAWPISVDRIAVVLEKSLREAGLRSSWTDPDAGYEAAVIDLAARTIREPELGRHVVGVVDAVEAAGQAAGLAQLLLQLLAPGVPDIYQGAEGWELSLVDPDNRRPVDPARRHDLLQRSEGVTVAAAWADDAARADGVVRTALLRTALAARRRHPDVAAYRPRRVDGPDADRVLAFDRGEPAALVVVAARPGAGGVLRADAAVDVPDGRWRRLLSGGEPVEGLLELASLDLPIELLERLR